MTGEELEISDLIDLKSARIVAPRPPTLTSIPSLLSTFQNEWDALALESFTIRQQLHQTRQELATALYQHDAAVRVIARLTAERNEARDALSKVSISAGSAGNGDAMQVDSDGLPEELAAKVDETQEKYDTYPASPIHDTNLLVGFPRVVVSALYLKNGLRPKRLRNLVSHLLRKHYIQARPPSP